MSFQCTGEQVKFDGFLKVYMESSNVNSAEQTERLLPRLPEGTIMTMESCDATPPLCHSLRRVGGGNQLIPWLLCHVLMLKSCCKDTNIYF